MYAWPLISTTNSIYVSFDITEINKIKMKGLPIYINTPNKYILNISYLTI